MGNSTFNRPETSIVIPVYNSKKTIGVLVETIINIPDLKHNIEIILVNDGSSDKSLAVCIGISEKYGFVKTINLAKNFGQHNAIIAGLNHISGELVILMDDDLQNSPEDIPKLLDKIEEGFDVVFANYYDKKHSPVRNAGSTFRDKAANNIFKKPEDVRISSFLAMRRYVADEIVKYKGPYTYIGGLILRSTLNIAKIDVGHRERKLGISNYSFFNLISHWINGIISFTSKPLRISFFFGLICFLLSLAFGIFLIINRIMNPDLIIGWTSVILAVSFFSGVQLIIVGLIGEYIGRIFLIHCNHPQYVIRETYNLDDKQHNNHTTGQ